MIERGWEVGGGDQRADVGVVARMVQVDALDDGRYAVVAVGTRRIRVNAWLPDDPYPLADVDDWPDEDPDAAGPRRRGRRGHRPAGRRCSRSPPSSARSPVRSDLGDDQRRPAAGLVPPRRAVADRAGRPLPPAVRPLAGRAAGPAGREPRRRRGDAALPARLSRADRAGVPGSADAGVIEPRPVTAPRSSPSPRDDDPTSIAGSSTSSRPTPSRRRSARSRAPAGGWRWARPAPRCSGSAWRIVLLGVLRLIQTEWDRVGHRLAVVARRTSSSSCSACCSSC